MSTRRLPGREPVFTLGNVLTITFGLLGATGIYSAVASSGAVTGQRVASAESDLTGLKVDMANARTSGARSETRIDALENRIRDAERRIDQLNDRINAVGDRRR